MYTLARHLSRVHWEPDSSGTKPPGSGTETFCCSFSESKAFSKQKGRNMTFIRNELPLKRLFRKVWTRPVEQGLSYSARHGVLHFHTLRSAELKAAKYEIQKPSICSATLFRCKFWADVSHFSPCVINLSRNKYFCCGVKKKSRVCFGQQILALLLHQTRNLSRNKFAHFARQVESFFISYFAAFTKGNWNGPGGTYLYCKGSEESNERGILQDITNV